jgi:hypothetical protein
MCLGVNSVQSANFFVDCCPVDMVKFKGLDQQVTPVLFFHQLDKTFLTF